MRFLIASCFAVVLIVVLAKPLKRHPAPFYCAALGLVALYLFGLTAHVSGGWWPYFMPLMQRCSVAFLLFSVVMFAGVLDDSSRVRARLMPIRRQLSILGCIFALGHIDLYASSYLPRTSSAFSGNLAFSLALAALLVALMIVLAVTSFQVVKHRMSAATWKGIQRLAYPFYLLTYVHLALLLLPSALAGKDTALVSLTVYTVVVLAYVVLRTRRAWCRKAGTGRYAAAAAERIEPETASLADPAS